MKTQLLLGALVAATVFQGSVPAYAGRENVGSIIGGVIGGAIGSQVGGGSGNKAATVIGAVAGAVIGGNVAGRDNDSYGRHGRGRPGRPGRPGHPGRPDYPPGRPGYPPGYPPGPGRPGPGYPVPPPNYGGQYQGSAFLSGISRQPGGRWYRIALQYPLSLTNIQLQVRRANMRIYETSVVTDYNQRLPVYEMSNTPVLGTGAFLNSYVNRNDRIVAIDIRAESYGDYADAVVTVLSREGVPSLIVQPY